MTMQRRSLPAKLLMLTLALFRSQVPAPTCMLRAE
jgi:hypothetical protein